jgi:selenium metabolism protein YedF
MALEKDFMLLLKSKGMGDAEPELRDKLMKLFLNTLYESGAIPGKIVFSANGVFLTTEGSPVLDILKKYEEAGTEILSCGTCLEYYDRKDKIVVGKVTSMKDTVNTMLTIGKVMVM